MALRQEKQIINTHRLILTSEITEKHREEKLLINAWSDICFSSVVNCFFSGEVSDCDTTKQSL